MSKIFIWLRRLVAVVGCLWLVVTCTPLVSWWARGLARPWGNCKGDVLVVLGGNALGDGVLGSSSYWRSVYTVRTMRAHSFRQVIISGGAARHGEKPASELMRDFVRSHGIDTTAVVPETESTTTAENAIRTKALLGNAPKGKIVLLTSDYHIWRAYRVFRKAGMDVEGCPVPDAAKRYGSWELRAGIFVELAVETGKIAWYRWKGWI